MAGQLVRVTACTFDAATVDGVREFSFSVQKVERRGRSDGQLGEATSDTIEERLTGTLVLDDEDGGAAALLMTGADGVLVVTGIQDGGTALTITIGVAVDNSGVVFTGYERTVSNQAGRPPEIRLTFEGKYHADHTVTISDATAFTDGTCLMQLVSA